MKVSFRSADQMLVEFHDPVEREVLLQLLDDAGLNQDPAILEQFAPDEDVDEWREWIRPELSHTFKGQIEVVADALRDDPDFVEIDREHFELWYGALNQSRLALENVYRFAGVDQVGEVVTWPEDKQSAFMRFQLALALQSALLDAMDSNF